MGLTVKDYGAALLSALDRLGIKTEGVQSIKVQPVSGGYHELTVTYNVDAQALDTLLEGVNVDGPQDEEE